MKAKFENDLDAHLNEFRNLKTELLEMEWGYVLRVWHKLKCSTSMDKFYFDLNKILVHNPLKQDSVMLKLNQRGV